MEYPEILLGTEQVSGLLTLFFLRVAGIVDLIHCAGLDRVYIWFWAGFVLLIFWDFV